MILDNLSNGNKEIVHETLPSVPLIIGDIGDRKLVASILNGSHETMKGKQITCVMHLAAFAYVEESIIKPDMYYNNNFAKCILLLQAIITENTKRVNEDDAHNTLITLVFSSTCATYGNPQFLPITELHPQKPINPYGKSKLFV